MIWVFGKRSQAVLLFLYFGFVGLLSAKSFAQNALDQEQAKPTETTQTPAVASAPPDIKALGREAARLLSLGDYDKIIETLSPILAMQEKPDFHLSYMRGRAALRLGFFRMAEKDLRPLGEYVPYKTWSPASRYLQNFEKLKAAAPPLIHEVKHDGQVVFRVYYDQADEWTGRIIALLPTAYRTSRDLVGIDMVETPVFIFRDLARFREFYSERGNGQPPHSWVWAAGSTGAFYFSQRKSDGTEAPRASSLIFRSTVVHEYNHCLVNRLLGAATVPHWFREGMAMVAESRAFPEKLTGYEERMRRVIASGNLLPLENLNRTTEFLDTVERSLEARQQKIAAPDLYVQSFDMARYFLKQIKPGTLNKFLMAVRDQSSFDKPFLDYSGMTVEEFFEEWQEQLNQTTR